MIGGFQFRLNSNKLQYDFVVNRKITKNDRKLRVYGRQKSNTYVVFHYKTACLPSVVWLNVGTVSYRFA